MRKKLTRTEKLLFLSPILVGVIICAMQFDWLRLLDRTFTNRSSREACLANIKQLSLSIYTYAQDNDNKWPLASIPKAKGTTFVGWADTISAHAKTNNIFNCPREPTGIDYTPTNRNYTDFYFNGRLSGLPKSQVANPAATLLMGDGGDGKDQTDATYNKTAIPPDWLTDGGSPIYRHGGGANYAMADGSVHWLRPDEVLKFGGRQNVFAPQ